MEKTLKEKQLTNLIKAKIYEAFGVVMYRVIDEATEECLENTSDLDEAIEDAKQFAERGGCYLVIDNNDKVVYKTSEISYKFESKKITEDKLRKIVAESVRRVLKEAIRRDPITIVNSLIDAANEAYEQAVAAQDGDTTPLQDRQGHMYGLSGKIKLDGRGYVIIPFVDAYKWGDYTPRKIRVLTKLGGKVQLINGDDFTEGWKDVKKMLNDIIKHASIGTSYFKNYDPNWEYSETPEEKKMNQQNLRAMNKQIGRRVNTDVNDLGNF